MTNILAGKSVLVTGGAGGIGLAAAMLFARDGAAVTLMGRSANSLEAAAAKITAAHPQAKIAVSAGDACRDEDVKAAVATATRRHGGLDITVATVGGGGGAAALADISADDFMAIVSYNLRSAFLAVRESAAAMPNGGSVVLTSSTAAVMPVTALGAYCAAKAAVDQLVRAAANELGKRGLRINSVRPGLTRTPGTAGLFAIDSLVQSIVARVPLGRTGEPEEVAAMIRHLGGPESSWVTGQSIAVDGGNELRGSAPFGPG